MSEHRVDSVVSTDLAGIIVGETAVSNVDGQRGLLSYRGVDINELVEWSFLQVVSLLLSADKEPLPNNGELEALDEFMIEQRRLSDSELRILKSMPVDLHPMLVLQGMVPLLQVPHQKISGSALLADEVIQRGLGIAAKIPTIIAARHRLVAGDAIVPSSDSLSLHENFLLMFHGKVPSREQVKILDVTQILQMEHSFNAGTFAGRVCASTLAPIQSSISASIGTLFGVLHGGADQAALEMARTISTVDKVDDFVTDCLKNKTKIMGMGHREYKVVDPRAKILKPMAMELCERGEARELLKVLEAVESVARASFKKQGKDIWANVEFYKGAVFNSLGIESHYFTALFAMARVYGYIAHFREFQDCSRLIRPRASYIGK